MKAVVFAGGSLGAGAMATTYCKLADLVVAVDHGLCHCSRLGIQADILLGDLDSVPVHLRKKAVVTGTFLHQYPKDKDKTDLELAFDLLLERKMTRAELFGALGGRWDMSLANLLLPAAEKYSTIEITIHDENTRIEFIRPGGVFHLHAAAGSRVSFLPLHGPVQGITLDGFQYPLIQYNMAPGSSLGISNILIANPGRIALSRGVLACILSDDGKDIA